MSRYSKWLTHHRFEPFTEHMMGWHAKRIQVGPTLWRLDFCKPGSSDLFHESAQLWYRPEKPLPQDPSIDGKPNPSHQKWGMYLEKTPGFAGWSAGRYFDEGICIFEPAVQFAPHPSVALARLFHIPSMEIQEYLRLNKDRWRNRRRMHAQYLPSVGVLHA